MFHERTCTLVLTSEKTPSRAHEYGSLALCHIPDTTLEMDKVKWYANSGFSFSGRDGGQKLLGMAAMNVSIE